MDLETKAGQRAIERKVKQLLLEVGVTPTEKGFYYLVDAIHIAVEDAAAGVKACAIMELYKEVAALHYAYTTARSVERCIRYAIERAFNKRTAKLESVFKGIEDKESGKVTNGCFIHTLAQYLLIQE